MKDGEDEGLLGKRILWVDGGQDNGVKEITEWGRGFWNQLSVHKRQGSVVE